MSRSARWFAVALTSGALACANDDGKDLAHGAAGALGHAGTGGAASGGTATGGTTATGGAGGAVMLNGGTGAGPSSGGAGATDAGSPGGSGRPGRGGRANAGGTTGTGNTTSGGTNSGGDGNAADGGSGAMPGGDGGSGGTGASTDGTPTLFWLDVSGKVLSSDATNFAVNTVVPSAGQGSDGIAVDVDAGYIYWTDMGAPADDDGTILRSNLDGSNVTTLVPKGGTYTPKQLKLVPEQHKLYWSDREGMRVMRSNVDGSAVETLYQSGSTDTDRKDNSRWCVGIAVDVAGGYFYWSQKGTDSGHEGSIRRAHLSMPDGDTPESRSDIEILFDGEAATCDLDLDLDAGLVYWANRGDDTINRGPLSLPSGADPKARSDKQTVVKKVDQAIGVFLDHARGLVYYTDAVGDVGRANLDGSSSKFLLTNAGAFTGIVVVELPR
ncbi:MAG TPA: hypothetical protein VGQ57_01390 [Polyangiaceae bacterium]|nr:hypothetical protein [Polyangiaceae bacterium]